MPSVSRLHRGGPVRIWERETRSNWFWGLLLPLVILASAPFTYGLSLLLVLVYGSARLPASLPASPPRRGQFRRRSSLRRTSACLASSLRRRGSFAISGAGCVPVRRLSSSTRGRAHGDEAPVAYLVNQYPHVSHSFIRRELAGLEAAGLTVERFSVRRSGAALVDKADQAEQQRTAVLLAGGLLGLLAALLWTACTSPLRWLKALALALVMGWRSRGGVLRHIVYLAEACVLVRRLRRCRARHLHAHFGTNAAAVALLTHTLGGPP